MSLHASLPMYDVPATTLATDRFWAAIVQGCAELGVEVPDALTRGGGEWAAWRDPDLLLSQTCGFPFVSTLEGHVGLIGTPDYGMIAGQPGWYDSVILVRADDPRADLAAYRGARFAYNDMCSQSGLMSVMFMLSMLFGNMRFFRECMASGGHVFSAQMVAQGGADIAALDCVTWAHVQRDHPDLGLRILTRTAPTPGLPYITGLGQDAVALANVIEAAIGGLSEADKDLLFLRGLWRSKPTDYALVHQRARAAAPVILAHFPDHVVLPED